MDYLELKSMVTSGKKKAYFLYAQDEQLIFEVRDILRKKVLKDVNSLSHFKLDGNKCTPEDLEIALSTYSMFNEDILVEISNCYFMEGSTNPLRVLVEEYLKDPREDLYFFGSYKYENDLSKKNFYLDNLKKKINPMSIIESIDSLKPRGVVTIIEERFASSNVEATTSPRTVRSISVTSSGRSSIRRTMRMTSGLLRTIDCAMLCNNIVLPAFGGATIIER